MVNIKKNIWIILSLIITCCVSGIRSESEHESHLLSQTDNPVPGYKSEISSDLSAAVSILSDPDSAMVFINAELTDSLTTSVFRLNPGYYDIEVIKDGYLPLTYQLDFEINRPVMAKFILKAVEPAAVTAEELDLEYLPEKRLKDLAAAVRLRKSFNRLTETFAIIPLGQGILARLILDEDYHQQANVLIISGASLTLGSWVLGKILSSAKQKSIDRENSEINRENEIIRQLNREVDEKVKANNQEAYKLWELENKNRGQVVIE